MKTNVFFDLEYWSDHGVKAGRWSGPNEYRELTEIGAVKVDLETLTIVDRFEMLCKPVSVPLTGYLLDLTHRTERDFDDASPTPVVISDFFKFVGMDTAWCYGEDGRVLLENFALHKINGFSWRGDGKRLIPLLDNSGICRESDEEILLGLYGPEAAQAHALSGGDYYFMLDHKHRGDALIVRTKDILPWFTAAGVDTDNISSGALARHFNLGVEIHQHTGVADAESIAHAAMHLLRQGHENIFTTPSRPLFGRTKDPTASAGGRQNQTHP